MTVEKSLPSPPSEKGEPPQYQSSRPSRFSEKNVSSQHCNSHTPSPTTFLDSHLRTPTARNAVDSINTALEDAVDGEHCTRCTANEAARTLTRYVFEVRHAKKTGNWSKEDKRAMKVELKGLMREVKGTVKEEKMRFKREGGQ